LNRDLINNELDQAISYAKQLLGELALYFRPNQTETRYPQLIAEHLREISAVLQQLRSQDAAPTVDDFRRCLQMMGNMRLTFTEVGKTEGGVTLKTDEFEGHMGPMLSNMERWIKVCLQELNR
jgi:hypothetical protein